MVGKAFANYNNEINVVSIDNYNVNGDEVYLYSSEQSGNGLSLSQLFQMNGILLYGDHLFTTLESFLNFFKISSNGGGGLDSKNI